MRLLDLFCGAGGAAMGYHRAGFEVVGVDIAPQPNYPFPFVQCDALDVPLWRRLIGIETGSSLFDAIHASPPCQFATAYRRTGIPKESPNLIPQTREILESIGLPWVIENVEQAASELRDPVMICGTMFDPPMDIHRHRLFETNWKLEPIAWPCRPKLMAPSRFKASSNRRPNSRATMEIGSYDEPMPAQRAVMGVDWPMSRQELSESIPPAYTEAIGVQLAGVVRNHVVGAAS